MSDRKEAAAKWAEAAKVLEEATEATRTAQEAYVVALDAERKAWLDMASLANRIQPDNMTVEIVSSEEHAEMRERMAPPNHVSKVRLG